MSVVAARRFAGGFEIAADSILVRYCTQLVGNLKRSKLWEQDGLIVGGVGTSEESVQLQSFSTTHRPADASTDAIAQFLSEFAFWKKQRTEKFAVQNDFIFGLDGRLFANHSLSVVEIETFEAIGAGQDFALAAMHLGKSVVEAVELACDLSILCERPVQLKRYVRA